MRIEKGEGGGKPGTGEMERMGEGKRKGEKEGKGNRNGRVRRRKVGRKEKDIKETEYGKGYIIIRSREGKRDKYFLVYKNYAYMNMGMT